MWGGGGVATCSGDSGAYSTHKGHGHSSGKDAQPFKGTDAHKTPRIQEGRQGCGARAFTGVANRALRTAVPPSLPPDSRGPKPAHLRLRASPRCKPTQSWLGTNKLVTHAATEPQSQRRPGKGLWGPPTAQCGRRFRQFPWGRGEGGAALPSASWTEVTAATSRGDAPRRSPRATWKPRRTRPRCCPPRE